MKLCLLGSVIKEKKKLFLLSVFLLLSGCGSPLQFYDPPVTVTDKYSKIELINTSDMKLAVNLYDDPINCNRPIWIKHIVKNSGIASQLLPQETFPIYAEKGKPFTVMSWYSTPWQLNNGSFSNQQCFMGFTFTPTKDGYKFAFGVGSDGKCAYDSLDHAENVTQRFFSEAIWNDGPWCAPMADASKS